MEQKVTVEGHINASINFSMQQNYVPVIRNLVIHNRTEQTLEPLEVRITFAPEFAKEYVCPVSSIGSGASLEISPVRIQMNTEYLFSLTERLVGSVTIAVVSGDMTLFCEDHTIEVLGYDQWSGIMFMPELIYAFVTPNHPMIAGVIQEASDILRKWTDSPAFTGYQTKNPNQVKLQMAAIYTALQKRGIVYQNPPASYEAMGQRVRLPHAVLEQKQGTCLDLAVLYASCLEAVGLYPLLLFFEGHAFCGCWLEETTFSDCVVDDVSSVEKRIAAGAEEMLLVECTDLTAGKTADFDRSVKHGKDHLSDPGQFVCVIDGKRARGSGIRPIPLRIDLAEGIGGEEDSDRERVSEAAPSMLDSSLMGRVTEGTVPMTKLQLWERKLLDFNLRNALLSFRVTKSALQLLASDLATIEDTLSEGKDLSVLPLPQELSGTLRDAKIFAIENDRGLAETVAAEELKSGRVRTFLNEEELDATLKHLYRSAKSGMEENGSNTLYLALGFLRWFETDKAERARYAPIVLVPVDLVRSVRSKGYVIRSRQEDAQINVTLLEYLRQEFGLVIGGLDPLPADEHGIDLPLVFHTVRQAVMGKSRWNIEELAFVGLFSFGQYVMWNDLRNRSDELKQNKTVASLMEGKLMWEPANAGLQAEELDEKLSLADMAIPMSADSSQLTAVTAAAAGESFVLHGPPGTGKSQTITNMIANALYQGKTVLFVAEKMAALNVVKKRLEGIGLGPFCLELHSNKTNKTSVLGQLEQSLEVGRIKSASEFEATAEHVRALRVELNEVMNALHEERLYGCSLYHAITLYEQNRGEQGKLTFDRATLEHADRDTIAKWDELLRRYEVAIKEIGIYRNHPLASVLLTQYSIEVREAFREESRKCSEELSSLKDAFEYLTAWNPALTGQDYATIDAMVRLSDAIKMPGVLMPEWMTAQNYEDLKQRGCNLVAVGKEYKALYQSVCEAFEPSVTDYDVSAAKLRWKQAECAWFLPKMTGQNKLVKELRLYAKNPSAITKTTISGYYDTLASLAEKKKFLEQAPSQLTSLLAGQYLGLSSDWDAISASIGKADMIRMVCQSVSGARPEECLKGVSALADDAQFRQAGEKVKAFLSRLAQFHTTYRIDTSMDLTVKDWRACIAHRLEQYITHYDKLRDMASFQELDEMLRASGLSNVSAAYRAGTLTGGDLKAAYTCALYYDLLLMTIAGDASLKSFRGKQYDDIICQYNELISRYQELTMQELAARLSAKIPASGTASASTSEMGILKRAIKSNGRMLSIRKLFDQIPNLLRTLCPCMLMSPISVAQYIDPSFPKYDLVIFDEASQLPTSEAVGTIARGENVIVVGDPKQLPPTNFFSTNRIDEENSEKEDLESLLDDCLAISMPQKYLKWHYRSRHESLIAYSNMKYYDNRLYTFPSPNDLVSEVKLVRVEGFYDKGKTKQNRAEAKAIVDEIIRRMSDEALRKESIGVVTFSSVQQNLIDDMLLEEWTKHPELEELDRKSAEPIFIKNLENVQGDERDVILFSIGYGPDKNGVVSMNFGPLNRDGGWRRLNVAISRARKSMVVYSVLRPEQIDLSRTRSEGVAGLKGFLEFAERGKTVVAKRADHRQKPEDALVTEIAAGIASLGYEVKCNIGCSEFKMDIGIVDPDNPETYLLGILLDSENSRETATARDRFVLQPSVLKGLGWHLVRIWTLDWLDDSDRVLRSVSDTIAQIGKQTEETVAEPVKKIVQAADFEREDPETVNRSAAKPYRSAKLTVQGMSDDFYLPKSKRKIQAAISKVLEAEAPISRKALQKKVTALWGLTRGGSRVDSVFTEALWGVTAKMTEERDRAFVWRADQEPELYDIYRTEDETGAKRPMEEVPVQEIRNAMLEVLHEQFGLSEEDLIRETAKKFGYTRIGGAMEMVLKDAIWFCEGRGLLERTENGTIRLA